MLLAALVWSQTPIAGQGANSTPRPAQSRPSTAPQQLPARPATAAPAENAAGAAAQRALLDQYCVTCHNARLKTANLLLDQLDLANAGNHAEVAEKVIRRVRAGMMPPTGMPRPDQATLDGLRRWMEDELDSHCVRSTCPLPACTA